ncbi:MAG: hypothetical protein KDJ97_24600 [Anaerolineae bacterium]|nr:hypothetical protein [Anaerolineae bacterium]
MADFNERIEKGSVSSSELTTSFLNEFEFQEAPLRWLNSQLKSVVDVDVFATDFPKSKGFKVNHADILLLRLERLNECAQEAFKEFIGIDQFTLGCVDI